MPDEQELLRKQVLHLLKLREKSYFASSTLEKSPSLSSSAGDRWLDDHFDNTQLDRKLRVQASIFLAAVLVFQLLFSDLVLWSTGTGFLDLSESVIQLFLAKMLLELIGIVAIVYQYLFPKDSGAGRLKATADSYRQITQLPPDEKSPPSA